MIYKILTADQLAELEDGGLMQAPVDIADGYVHFSTSKQLQETLSKWFRGQTGLFIAAVATSDFPETLKWEISRDGDYFPHVYDEVRLHNVTSIWPIDTYDADGAPLAPHFLVNDVEPASKPSRA